MKKDPVRNMPLLCKLTGPELYFLYWAHRPQEAIFLCLSHPGAKFQASRDHPESPKPAELTLSSQS